MNFITFINSIALCICFLSCTTGPQKAKVIAMSKAGVLPQTGDAMETEKLLASQMVNKVYFDSLLRQITHQEKVKVVAILKESWDAETHTGTYSDSNYNFKLHASNIDALDNGDGNSTFSDGPTKISFKECQLTHYGIAPYRLEDYGFNWKNSFSDPKIIEVCGKRFFYSNVLYWCNGIGCGCFITFIYDLQTHQPTFLENYRLPFDGFYLSDFDNDNQPDLLVVAQTQERPMKGFALEEFDVKLLAYKYNKGIFEIYFDQQYQRPYCYDLYSFTKIFNHSSHNEFYYSVINNHWFRL